MIEETMKRWHEYLESHDSSDLEDLLADDCVFHSPIVHTPQEGKALTMMYLGAAGSSFEGSNFTYVREVMSGDSAVLEFTSEIDGIFINGIDMIRCNGEGKIVEFKVMIRPLKAINLMHKKMKAMLEQMSSA